MNDVIQPRELERKALYNLLRLNWHHDPSLPAEPWQVEDYRSWSSDELIARVAELCCPINRDFFLACAAQCDVPEELTGCFLEEDANVKKEDQLYLVVFELWRRLLPERMSVSIFCDELDARLAAYDAGLPNEEDVDDALARLQDLLDENVDAGANPQLVFKTIAAHSAHEIENFLYDYIVAQVEAGSRDYALELVDGFAPYVVDRRWFDFVKARLLAFDDVGVANQLLQQVLAQEPHDLDLNLEILDFLSCACDRALFLKLAKQTVGRVETEEDLIDLLTCCVHYFRCLDKEDKEAAIERLIHCQCQAAPSEPVDQDDDRIHRLVELLD